jgi:hypothetical protein
MVATVSAEKKSRSGVAFSPIFAIAAPNAWVIQILLVFNTWKCQLCTESQWKLSFFKFEKSCFNSYFRHFFLISDIL